jgi:UDP-N-acetylglucosamine 2-epimerase (non-hydrolysing)
VRALCVAGARPNFVKVKPLVDALEARAVDVVLVHTGQHYDEALSDVFFDELGLRAPDHWLGVGSGTQAEQTAGVMTALEPLLATLDVDTVIVVGDVNSTMAAALVAAKACLPLAHVEAGLRSNDRTMPEEINRIVTDHVSTALFAPTPDAVENLLAEGIAPKRIEFVGNVMVDTLLANLDRALARPIVADLGLSAGEYGVVTLHRPANVDEPGVLKGLLAALGRIAAACPLVFPAHPRTARQLAGLELPGGLRVVEPVGYLDFVALEASARLVLTDSGGVQEETTVLGVPCLTLRDTTERPVTVWQGTNTVVGRDPERIAEAAAAALAAPWTGGEGRTAECPTFWDGHAAERIADVLVAGE